MRTNIDLNDALILQALKLSKIKTKRKVVEEALKKYIAFLKRKQLLVFKGKVVWEGDLNKYVR